MTSKLRPRVLTESLRVPVEPSMKADLRAWATAAGLSLSDAARTMIRNGLDRDETLAERIYRQVGKALVDFNLEHRKHLTFPDPSAEDIRWSEYGEAIDACTRLGLTDVLRVLRQGDLWFKQPDESQEWGYPNACLMEPEYWHESSEEELRMEICLVARVVLRAIHDPAQEAKSRLMSYFRESRSANTSTTAEGNS